ncbi:hypothetical protein SARC_13549, partial [Sphaeroforma arctica JP610]
MITFSLTQHPLTLHPLTRHSVLTGIVEKVDGNTTIRCASNGACIVNEKVLDKLFRGGVHLQCSAGECVYKHEPVPSTKPQPIPTPGPEARRQYE